MSLANLCYARPWKLYKCQCNATLTVWKSQNTNLIHVLKKKIVNKNTTLPALLRGDNGLDGTDDVGERDAAALEVCWLLVGVVGGAVVVRRRICWPVGIWTNFPKRTRLPAIEINDKSEIWFSIKEMYMWYTISSCWCGNFRVRANWRAWILNN